MRTIDRSAPVALLLAAESLDQLESVVGNLRFIYGDRLWEVEPPHRDREGLTILALQVLASEAARPTVRGAAVRLVSNREEGA